MAEKSAERAAECMDVRISCPLRNALHAKSFLFDPVRRTAEARFTQIAADAQSRFLPKAGSQVTFTHGEPSGQFRKPDAGVVQLQCVNRPNKVSLVVGLQGRNEQDFSRAE
jgi:hypothetical protein